MPGNVASFTPATVLPEMFWDSFTRSGDWGVDLNTYQNGEQQTRARVAAGRNQWSLGAPLTVAQLAALEAFYLARKGSQESFYFYDATEGAYDGTGVATAGRYRVRFDGGLQAALSFPRSSAQFGLVEA